jgi:predicted phage tail protein
MNFEAISLEYLIIALAGVILYLLYYVFNKDSEYSRNIRSVASVVEELNREIYYLKKKLNTNEKQLQQSERTLSDEEIYQEIERSVYDMIQPLSVGLRQAKEAIHAINEQVDSRISLLESGVKQISIPSSVHGNDDAKIVSLYKQGVSLETISKELHISQAEVEFVLKINKIK